jgi:hypothetical protein
MKRLLAGVLIAAGLLAGCGAPSPSASPRISSDIAWLRYKTQLLPPDWSIYTPGVSSNELAACQNLVWNFLGLTPSSYQLPAIAKPVGITYNARYLRFQKAGAALTKLGLGQLAPGQFIPPQVTNYVDACQALHLT